MNKIIYSELSYEVQGVIFDVYNKLGNQHKEEVYQKAMLIGLSTKGLKVVPEKTFEIFYKGQRVGLYRTDIIVEDKIILELKAVPEISNLNMAQLISYLNVTGKKLGILINFGSEKLFFQRIAMEKNNNRKIFNFKDINFRTDLDRRVLEALKEIHGILGPGFFHHIYRRAAYREFFLRKIPFSLEKKIKVFYKGKFIYDEDVRLYIVCNDLLLWIRAVQEIDQALIKEMQLYMDFFDKKQGIIVNFNSKKLNWKYIDG
ncbi:MAG: GxxExxY protein [Patescibacteria group bacterium]|nr:GxxExxY protein [Patescibacteria group bacterium]